MGIPVLILGESGVGKSTSLRNIEPDGAVIVQPISKPLPFRSQFKKMTKDGGQIRVTDNSEMICRLMEGAAKAGKKQFIIDDAQYIMANEFMRRCSEKSYEKYTEIGHKMWSIINHAQSLDSDMRVYFMSHTETDSLGRSKIKTIGKMLDEKITLEGMFTIVIGCKVEDNKHVFLTKNSGMDTIKTPMGMFESGEIDNDLAYVDNKICQYYDIT